MSRSLLPPNATDMERALETVIASAHGRLAPEVIATLWTPATCPEPLLPWLAWACSVDEWDDAWPEVTRRRVIADSYSVHAVKGTVGAVKRALASLGYDTRLVEWPEDDPPAEPYTFRVEVDVMGHAVTARTYAEIERTARAAKNVRSHLTGVRAVGRVDAAVYAGAFVIGGTGGTVLPWTPPEITVSGPSYAGAAVTMVSTLTVHPAREGA
ncbi:phage tail protein I [Roseospira marina]|uniref:Phage tail protein I n=1 Tax=Roseospira marina TaxID=140057 RepID=A0A5M6I4L2_9PROT|nr:phage tail protein I [Roseospira marina]KAA5602797.1 phage tail protein I [Roseospira marina]MBB4316222.1 phage tail P2-like protein [Roseospira marina]MBB5089425.1 phage tail P2-like protein [Roseospira marina]